MTFKDGGATVIPRNDRPKGLPKYNMLFVYFVVFSFVHMCVYACVHVCVRVFVKFCNIKWQAQSSPNPY